MNPRISLGAFAVLLACAITYVALSAAPGQQSSSPGSRIPDPGPRTADFDTVVKTFLAKHCYECHGNKKQREDLNLEAFTSAQSLVEHRDRWDLVVEKLRGKEMPPADEPQPVEVERQAVATWVARELERIDRATPPDPGRVTARRLNRAEYNNTIRDLVGVDLRPADDFPQDDSGYGFDNIGDVLSLSPALMEKYLKAAERVARTAIFGPPPMQPTLTRLRSEGRRVREARKAPASYDVSGLSLPNAFHAVHQIPVDGEYIVRVFLGGLRPLGSEPITIALWIDERELKTTAYDPESTAQFELDRQDFGGKTLEFRVKLEAGERWVSVAIPRIFEGLPARLGGPNPSKRVARMPEFRPRPNSTPEQIAAQRKRFDEAQAELEKIPMNGVRINAVEIGGPYAQATGPSAESRKRIFTCGHAGDAHLSWCAARIMTDFTKRALRRPVAGAEIARLVTLVRNVERQDGLNEALAVGIQAVLVSPDFLFRVENAPAGSKAASARASASQGFEPISQHDLATRLSYFLWSSLPDAELRRVADTGQLRQPQVLAAQVRRMLRDPKSQALAENFGGQWLQFRALESTTRDREKFPDFEDYLRLSMRRETELFLEHIIREDRSILDFIDGRYTYVNERLARHYGMTGVTGPQFRRVQLTDPHRGGVLTHASVLTVSSYSTRTSPVLRGKWILENLLNAPPPEPPPDVPNLDETAIGSVASLRAQLEQHRTNPTCASCHRKMDPLGFGLENFDAVGAWRAKDGKFDIDASGTLPDGETFEGPEELRAILRDRHEAFARGLTAKLLTYSLGRGLERYDARTVRAIAKRLPSQQYRFSALVLEIVNSFPFQHRRHAMTAVAQASRPSHARTP